MRKHYISVKKAIVKHLLNNLFVDSTALGASKIEIVPVTIKYIQGDKIHIAVSHPEFEGTHTVDAEQIYLMGKNKQIYLTNKNIIVRMIRFIRDMFVSGSGKCLVKQ